MARNLQAKLPSSDTIRIFDINSEIVKRFSDETKALSSGAAVEVADSVRGASEDSVSCSKSSFPPFAFLHFFLYMMSLFYTHDLSWGHPSWVIFV